MLLHLMVVQPKISPQFPATHDHECHNGESFSITTTVTTTTTNANNNNDDNNVTRRGTWRAQTSAKNKIRLFYDLQVCNHNQFIFLDIQWGFDLRV